MVLLQESYSFDLRAKFNFRHFLSSGSSVRRLNGKAINHQMTDLPSTFKYDILGLKLLLSQEKTPTYQALEFEQFPIFLYRARGQQVNIYKLNMAAAVSA